MSHLSLSISLCICCSLQLFQDLLDRPVENLLMNQANHFRETQEQREFLNQVMPFIHSGYVWHTFTLSGLTVSLVVSQTHSSCFYPCSTLTTLFKALSSFSMFVCVFTSDVLGLPCGQWVLESPSALWRWNERHHSHSDSDRAGKTETCNTCSTTKKHTPGIGYKQTSTVQIFRNYMNYKMNCKER